MSVGERHTLNGYTFVETLHGPFGPDRCVDVNCGATIYSVVPTGRIGAGGLLEDTGADVPGRCSTCGRAYHGVVARSEDAVPAVPFPSDIQVRRARQEPRPTLVPAPDHTSRDAPNPNDRIPRVVGVTRLALFATQHGWDVAVTYARGPWLSARGVPIYPVHSWAVRGMMNRGTYPRQLHALYVRPTVEKDSTKWMCDHVLLLPYDPPGIFPYANVTQLRDWIRQGGDVPMFWYRSIRAQVVAAREAARHRAKGMS
jgi:hypothetical protein